MNKGQGDIRMTYLGNVELNNHIRKNNISETFSVKPILKGVIILRQVYKYRNSQMIEKHINKNLENVMFLRDLNIKA